MLATAILRARRGEVVDTTNTLTAYIPDLRAYQHPILDTRSLFAGVTTVAVSRMSNATALQTYLF